ncbi:leucine-rich repeat and calponin homology domain-containing protein 4-like isoform X2 [Polyodon spathula]|uniref:leucine-rich repeat and calponin homology domain-containing protein 4-like isoform X2 n=1 Tax=Polyodon spathula TaxID=7913 RepID=UPI001B7E4C4B|nr:leucine-rich repeat and calponin homology domain-containing protein 4-like isoform X2 [Polyodon spathula]
MAAGEESALPAGIAGSRSVEKALEETVASGALNLSNRKLRVFPSAARNYDLSDVTQADLSKNRLSELPEELCQLISLETLNMYHNCARSIPDSIVNLQALSYLNISRNQLTFLPAYLCHLPLKVLIASNNKLSALPDDIEAMGNLRQLDVSCNEIQSLPPQIGSLESLRDLSVRRNNITVLPDELSELPLVRLDFSCNRVTRIPVCYRHLRHLQAIVLDNNPLQCPPAQICTKGKVHIFKFLNIEACSKTVQELEGFQRVARPTGFASCLSDEFCPVRQYEGLDSGFNSVDSGSKRWSGNESADDFSDLSLRMAEITRDQRQLRESRSTHMMGAKTSVNGEVEQIDFIDSSLNGEDSKSDSSPQQQTAPPEVREVSLHAVRPKELERENTQKKTSSPKLEATDKTQSNRPTVCLEPPGSLKGSRDDSGSTASPASPPSDERRRPEILQIWKERERQQQQQAALRRQGAERRDSCAFKSAQRTGASAMPALQTASTGGSQPETSSLPSLKQRSQSSDQAPVNPAPSRSVSKTEQAHSPRETGSTQKPNSFLFRSASKNVVKPAGSVTSLVDTGISDSKSGLLSRSSSEHLPEEKELIAQLRKTLESRLRRSLPEDLGEALSNGATLCQLANHVRPRSVAIIHVPSPAVPKISVAKCRRNVQNFIDACRKLGVPEADLCLESDILQGNVCRVKSSVEALLRVEAAWRPAACLGHYAGFSLFYSVVMLLLYLAYCKLSVF